MSAELQKIGEDMVASQVDEHIKEELGIHDKWYFADGTEFHEDYLHRAVAGITFRGTL
jgi:hypothetical protein